MYKKKTQDQVSYILTELRKTYPDAGCALDYDSIFHLVIAVALSAQTTDVSVNKVTPALFRAYETPEQLAAAPPEEIEGYIRTLGLYKNKAKNIRGMAEMLVHDYGSEVPQSMEELQKLPGVGRKTANVVLSEGFHEQRIAVDTHVFRVSNRIGLAHANDVGKTEEQLMDILPYDHWIDAHHLLIFHGRRCCKARKPSCEECPIRQECEAFLKGEV